MFKKITLNIISTFLCLTTILPLNMVGIVAEETDISNENNNEIIEINSENTEEFLDDVLIVQTPSDVTVDEAEEQTTEVQEKVEEVQTEEVESETIEEVNMPEFNDSVVVDDVQINVSAPDGVFPENSTLSVEKVLYHVQNQVDNVLNDVRNEDENVVSSYTFDIKILDSDGNEIQPKDNSKVKVVFSLAEASNDNLNTSVYHIDDKQDSITVDNVQPLEVKTEGEDVIIETDGFSIYTVEFTYNNKEFVIEGDSWIKLSSLLEQIELTGNIESWQVSDSNLFDICLGNDEEPSFDYYSDEEGNEYSTPTNIGNMPYLVSFEPFDTTEWLKVIIDGIEYEIIVTDDQVIINGVTQNIPGVTQGEYISNFTSDMQVATIFIDETVINQLPASGNSATGKILNGYDAKGFYFADSHNYSSRTGNVLHFNASKWKTTVDNGDGTTTEKTGFYPKNVDGINNYWIDFPGDVVEYVFKNGAESSTGVKYDVIVTFSDVRISLQNNVGATMLSEANSGKVTYSTFAGNAVLISNRFNDGATITGSDINNSTNNGRYGLMYNANIRVVEDADATTRITVPGTFIYPMVDIDVDRSNQGNFRYFYESSKYRNYSEQIQITSNNFGDVFIPFQTSETDATKYKASIENTTDGLLFYPRITSDSDTLLTGFVTLANNSRGGINVRGWSAGSAGAGVETYLLTGGKVGGDPTIINHKIKSSTKTFKLDGSYEENSTKGGTIETTQAGNQDGTLDDGTTILGPNILTVASGETVNYTLTPNIGYKATAVYVKEGSLDYTEGGEITPTPVYDEDGVIKYYTFKFERINKDNAIHVEWEPDVYPLKVTKTTTDNIAGTFDYTLELSTRKTTKARIYNISIVAGIETTTDEETGTSTTSPYYYFFNTGDEFVVNGITIPTGSFTNGGTGVGLDAICDVLMGTIQENPITVQLGSELGTLSTEAVTSVADQIQELLDDEYTSAALDAITYTFSSPEKTEIIPWAFEELPVGVEGSNGTYTFKVANGETFTIPNMPNGVYYTLTEQAKDGWTCKSTNPINTRIKNANGDFNYLNEYNAYDLVIKKETVDNEEGSFSFVIDIDKEVEIPAQSIDFLIAASASGGQVSYNLINNKPQFTVEYNGQHIAIPAGTYIYGTDENIDNFINILTGLDDVDSVEMKLNGEEGIVSTEETETLASKTQALLDEGYSMFALEPVAFNISSSPRIDRAGLEFDTLPDGVIGTNGLYRFTLTNGQSVTFSGIPHGYEYEVKEAEDIEWELIKIEETSTAEILQVDFEDLSTITPVMEVNGHIVTTGGGQQPGDHFQPQVYSSQTYMRLRYSTDGKTNEFTSTNHTVSYDDEITFVYPQAAIMPDGSKKDVLVTVSNISITKPETVSSMNVNFKGAIFRATGGPALATRSFGINATQRTPSSYTVNETIKVSLASSSKNEVFKVVFDGNEYVGNGHDGITFNGQISGSSNSTTVKAITLAKQENIDGISANEVIENPEAPEYFNTVDSDSMVTYTNKKVPKYDLTVKKETENNAPGTFNFTAKIYREETHPGVNHTVQIEASIINGEPRYVLHNMQHALEIPGVGFIPAGSYVYGGSNQILNGIIENLINNASSENPYEFTIDEQDWAVNTDTETPIGVQIEDLINQGQTGANFEPVHYTYISEPKVVKHYFVPEPLPEGVTENDGVLSFSLENGKSITFEEILKGHKFEIFEASKEGWRNIEKVNDTGVLEEDTVAKFINKKLINLTIRKETDIHSDEEFRFKIRIIAPEVSLPGIDNVNWVEYDRDPNDGGFESYYADLKFKDAVELIKPYMYTNRLFVELDNGARVPIEGIEWGDRRFIDGSGRVSFVSDDSFDIEKGHKEEFNKTTYRMTNYPEGTDEYIKAVAGYCVWPFKSFKPYLKAEYMNLSDFATPIIDDTTIAGNPDGYEYWPYPAYIEDISDGIADDGWYEFILKSGNEMIIPEIPYGYEYEIYELDSEGNEVAVGDTFDTKWILKSATNTSGTLEETTTSVFTNEIKRGSINIKKETKGNEEGEFKFKAKVWKSVPGTIENDYVDIGISTSSTEDFNTTLPQYFVDFKFEKTTDLTPPIIIDGYEIPNLNFTATDYGSVSEQIQSLPEDEQSSYDLESYDKISSIIGKARNNEEVSVIINGNSYKVKFQSENTEERTQTLRILPDVYNLTEQLGDIGDDGHYEFTLNNGENFTIDEIPFGYRYEVYEENPEGWDLVSIDGLTPREKAEGVIESETPYKHTFLNAKRHKLVFEKKVTGNMGDKSKEFVFRARIVSQPAEIKHYYSVGSVVNLETQQGLIYWNDMTYVYGDNAETFARAWTQFSENLIEFIINLNEPQQNILQVSTQLLNKRPLYTFDDFYYINENGDAARLFLDYDKEYNRITIFHEVIDGYYSDNNTATKNIIYFINLSKYGGTYDENGYYTFKLKHGDRIEIEVPYGYEYEITEEDYSNEGYKQKVDGKAGREVSGELTEDKNHLFENRNQAAVPTEIRIAQFGVISLIILGILFVVKKRRKGLAN